MDTPHNKPTPIRLKDMKVPLQQEAMEIDRSLHWVIVRIIKDYLDKKKIIAKQKRI